MTKYNSIKIESIDDKSPYLSAVIDLWKPHRATLGLFPRDAFVERAAKRQILVAINAEGESDDLENEELNQVYDYIKNLSEKYSIFYWAIDGEPVWLLIQVPIN